VRGRACRRGRSGVHRLAARQASGEHRRSAPIDPARTGDGRDARTHRSNQGTQEYAKCMSRCTFHGARPPGKTWPPSLIVFAV